MHAVLPGRVSYHRKAVDGRITKTERETEKENRTHYINTLWKCELEYNEQDAADKTQVSIVVAVSKSVTLRHSVMGTSLGLGWQYYREIVKSSRILHL